MNEQSVYTVPSPGASCFWCGKEITADEICVAVVFDTKIFLVGKLTKYGHDACAEEVGLRLNVAALDAQRKNSFNRNTRGDPIA